MTKLFLTSSTEIQLSSGIPGMSRLQMHAKNSQFLNPTHTDEFTAVTRMDVKPQDRISAWPAFSMHASRSVLTDAAR